MRLSGVWKSEKGSSFILDALTIVRATVGCGAWVSAPVTRQWRECNKRVNPEQRP